MDPTTFEAIADSTRRELLDRLLSRGPMTLRQLAEDLHISRQAVTKHLDALHRVGLVSIDRRGRERVHALDPIPLRSVDDWLAPYAAAWDERLERLRTHLEEEPT